MQDWLSLLSLLAWQFPHCMDTAMINDWSTTRVSAKYERSKRWESKAKQKQTLFSEGRKEDSKHTSFLSQFRLKALEQEWKIEA